MPFYSIQNEKIFHLASISNENVTREIFASQYNVPLEDVEEITALEYDTRLAERSIKRDLRRVDAASVRSLRAIILGQGTDEDRAKLAALEEQAQALRLEFATLRA